MADRPISFASAPSMAQDQPSQRWMVAAALAFAGALNPLPVPITGIHKFYLGQPLWGGIYLLLGWTQIPRIACVMEGVWYLTRVRLAALPEGGGTTAANDGIDLSQQTQAIATALRELEKLRQEGLISEQEFEQKRRRLLERLN